jgi:hypothetical protein
VFSSVTGHFPATKCSGEVKIVIGAIHSALEGMDTERFGGNERAIDHTSSERGSSLNMLKII